MFRLTTAAFAALVASSSFPLLVQGQFAGIIFGAGAGDCPSMTQNEPQQELSWVAGSPICGDVSGLLDEGGWGAVGFTANIIGTNAITPTQVGACASDDCSDCDIYPIDQASGTGIRHDCLPFKEQTYFYMTD